MPEPPTQQRDRQLDGPKVAVGIAVVVAVITGIFAVVAMTTRDEPRDPGSELYQGEPIAEAGGLELYLAEFSNELRPIPDVPYQFDGELRAGTRIFLRLVWRAEEEAAGDDIFVVWTRDGEQIRRSRMQVMGARGTDVANLEQSDTDQPGTYRAQVLIEETPLTELTFEVVSDET